jgi:hypothetical protein
MRSAAQTERAPNRCLAEVENGIQRDMQFKHRSDDRERTQGGVLPLAQMSRELRWRDPLVGGDVERWIARAIPAVITDPSGETSINYAERGIRGDMSNTDAAPWADVRVERALLGTPSYVEASSAKTRSISPLSISCNAVTPPNTGSGVAMNCGKASRVWTTAYFAVWIDWGGWETF